MSRARTPRLLGCLLAAVLTAAPAAGGVSADPPVFGQTECGVNLTRLDSTYTPLPGSQAVLFVHGMASSRQRWDDPTLIRSLTRLGPVTLWTFDYSAAPWTGSPTRASDPTWPPRSPACAA